MIKNGKHALKYISCAIDELGEYQSHGDRDEEFWNKLEEAETFLYKVFAYDEDYDEEDETLSLEEDLNRVFNEYTREDKTVRLYNAEGKHIEKALIDVLGYHPDECNHYSIGVETVFEAPGYSTGFISICYTDPIYKFLHHITEKWEEK